jgi:hypothetical protein
MPASTVNAALLLLLLLKIGAVLLSNVQCACNVHCCSYEQCSLVGVNAWQVSNSDCYKRSAYSKYSASKS